MPKTPRIGRDAPLSDIPRYNAAVSIILHYQLATHTAEAIHTRCQMDTFRVIL